MSELCELIERLQAQKSVRDKIAIRDAYAPVEWEAGPAGGVGDDCAAIPDGEAGHLLLAAEGLLADFVSSDPWFAGYSAVMVNLSDVAAMGGRPLAIVDVLWTPAHAAATEIWDGMRAASRAYGVPIVGGHTTLTDDGDGIQLAAAVVGRATSLMTSFDARPGDDLLMAVDLRGDFRRDKPFWNASSEQSGARLRAGLDVLPEIAEASLCRSAKDISNGGLIGTLVMLLECSHVGATLDLARLPRPEGVDLFRWLISFPSYGFVLAVDPERDAAVRARFEAEGITCAAIGRVESGDSLHLELNGESAEFWRAPASATAEESLG